VPAAQSPFEQFDALRNIPDSRHVFTQRVSGVDVSGDKAAALRQLETAHREVRSAIGVGDWPLLTAEQVHGDKIAIVYLPVDGDKEFAGCDGIITNQREIALGIHVADCCAVYIVDPITHATGLVHSGKKGTELAIVTKAIGKMKERFGSNSADLVVQLSPCIRPPHYEIDFAAKIVEQCRAAGAKKIYDSGVCTACDLTRYYSYRAEKGKTGRMLALLGLD
jgi:copper oxidase (laccase) domain-containing protein